MPLSRAVAVGGIIYRVLKYLLIAIIIIIPIRLFVAQPFIVSGDSMWPTYDHGEYVIINKIAYETGQPVRGDVIVFQYPLDPSYYFIKRIVGMPGETVTMNGDTVTVLHTDGSKETLVEPYATSTNVTKNSSVTALASNEYFVLGDNRDVSTDSREWGPLQKKFIVGKVLTNFIHITDAGFLSRSQKFIAM